MITQRIGVVSVAMELLGQWMHLPPGTRIVDVRRRDVSPFGEFEILVEGDAVPETRTDQLTPKLICIVTKTEPKVEFSLATPTQQ